MTHGGDIEQQIRSLLAEHPDMPKTEMADILGISRKTLYKHLGRLENGNGTSAPPISAHKAALAKSNDGVKAVSKPAKHRNLPPPGPHKSAFKKGNPGGPGGPPGNDKATKTGEHRNPLLHYVPEDDAKRVREQVEKSPVDLQRESVLFYDARLVDMTKRLAKLQAQRKDMLTIGTEYVRQEGDGELSGTYRQAKRKRQRLDDRIFELHEAITRTQAKRDAAVAKLHDMQQAAQGPRKKGIADVLADMDEDKDDEDGEEP